MDKEEIVEISRRIGTFDISIEPYEDCCTVFTPRHPRTKPVLEKVLVEERKLDFDALVEEAIKGALKDYYDKNGIEYDHSQFPDCEHCEHCH